MVGATGEKRLAAPKPNGDELMEDGNKGSKRINVTKGPARLVAMSK